MSFDIQGFQEPTQLTAQPQNSITGSDNLHPRTTLYWNEGSGEVGLVMCSASNLKLVFPAIVAGVRTCSIAYTEHQASYRLLSAHFLWFG